MVNQVWLPQTMSLCVIMAKRAKLTILITKVPLGVVATKNVEELDALKIIPTCVKQPKDCQDARMERHIVVKKIARQ